MKKTMTTTRKIKASNDEKVTVTFTVDFSNASDEDLMEWALSNRVIAGQRPWRELSPEEIRQSVHNQTFDATTIGQKIRSREDQIKATMNPALGIDREMAEWIVDNPEEYKKMLDEMKSKK